ncbi:hypothetical protein BaRGS_00039296 [Batillaria attramentaria]|uniref:Uncharacterized protein n=1 Tax=Batillaria attramentaria TaxID=370345 RepID=A0ABD0J3Q8_9CAEN
MYIVRRRADSVSIISVQTLVVTFSASAGKSRSSAGNSVFKACLFHQHFEKTVRRIKTSPSHTKSNDSLAMLATVEVETTITGGTEIQLTGTDG